MNDIKQRLWIPVAFSVGATVGIAGAYLLLKNPPMPGVGTVYPPLPTSTDQTSPYPTGAPEIEPWWTNQVSSTETNNDVEVKDEVTSIEIVWTKPKEIDLNEKLKLGLKESEEDTISTGRPLKNGYDIGFVKEGEYKDYRLIKWQWEEYGLMTFPAEYNLLLSPDAKLVYISNLKNAYGGDPLESIKEWLKMHNISPKSFRYQEIIAPQKTLTLKSGKKISLLNTDREMTRYQCTSASCSLSPIATAADGTKIYEDSANNVHYGFSADGTSNVFIYTEDGGAYGYSTLPEEFISVSMSGESYYSTGKTVLSQEISWEGSPVEGNSGYDTNAHGGCGATIGANIVDIKDVNQAGGVKRVGTYNGSDIYVPVNPDQHPLVKQTYDSWYVADDEKTMAAFLKKYPIPLFLSKDVLGRWFQAINTDAVPVGECGKPVIYLYPEKTTDVSVRLPSFIDVTVSEPSYPSSGWKVTAHPDGSLQYADGKTYESLYWEGTGVNYQVPKTGWVIKGSEVDSFLTRTLTAYGLNQKESQDFKDFWLPIMQKHNLMRVSFLVEDWSKAAPLSVSPRPDTNIRIFMDWQPLSEPISIKPPVIKTPARTGFTLVEWGGMLFR